MGEALTRLMLLERASKVPDQQRSYTSDEQRALDVLRREAVEADSFLAAGGEGGLPPSLALGVMRRNQFQCVECDQKGTEHNGVELHHLDKDARPRNAIENLATICEMCHDGTHEEERHGQA